jgi:urease accessory protein
MSPAPLSSLSATGRTKLHVYTSSTPVLLLRVVRFLSGRAIPVEVGNNFVKFPRGETAADMAASELKAMGFRVLTSMDQFDPEHDATLKDKSAVLLAAEGTPKGHVHGPGCGHDHVHDEHCGHDHHEHGHGHHHAPNHQEEQRHKHEHEHGHKPDHGHEHDHQHGHGHSHDHEKKR